MLFQIGIFAIPRSEAELHMFTKYLNCNKVGKFIKNIQTYFFNQRSKVYPQNWWLRQIWSFWCEARQRIWTWNEVEEGSISWCRRKGASSESNNLMTNRRIKVEKDVLHKWHPALRHFAYVGILPWDFHWRTACTPAPSSPFDRIFLISVIHLIKNIKLIYFVHGNFSWNIILVVNFTRKMLQNTSFKMFLFYKKLSGKFKYISKKILEHVTNRWRWCGVLPNRFGDHFAEHTRHYRGGGFWKRND